MGNDKFKGRETGENFSGDTQRKEQNVQPGSIFSQNLELKASKASTPQPPAMRQDDTEGVLDSKDRQVYFQVEARKVLDILKGELDRLRRGNSASSGGSLKDIYSGWQALWGKDEQPPASDFNILFRIAYTLLSLASDRRRELTPVERGAVARLLEAMNRLASGETGQDFLPSYREVLEKCHSVIRELEAPCRTPDGEHMTNLKSKPGPVFQQELPFLAGKPEEKEPAGGEKIDISVSVDRWFAQVSDLVKEPETVAPEQGQVSSSIGPLPEQKDPAAALEAPQVSNAVAGFPEQKDQAECPAVVRIYFTEQCGETLELINSILPHLGGPATRRTSRMLVRFVAETHSLAEDLGFATSAGQLSKLQDLFTGMISSTERDEIHLLKATEKLRPVIAQLERELLNVSSSVPT